MRHTITITLTCMVIAAIVSAGCRQTKSPAEAAQKAEAPAAAPITTTETATSAGAQSWVWYGNQYVAFTPPAGWTRTEVHVDDFPERIMRMTSPNGRALIEVHQAFNSLHPEEHTERKAREYIERIEHAGRQVRTRTLEVSHPTLDIASSEWKVMNPQKNGPLLVDAYPSFECYYVYHGGWLQQVCAYRSDGDVADGDVGKTVQNFISSMQPNHSDLDAVQWKPGA